MEIAPFRTCACAVVRLWLTPFRACVYAYVRLWLDAMMNAASLFPLYPALKHLDIVGLWCVCVCVCVCVCACVHVYVYVYVCLYVCVM